MPRAPPNQRFPSRSSYKAVTAPTDRPSRCSSDATPRELTRYSPLPVPIQIFDSRSLIMARICTWFRSAGTPACVTSVPVQRTTPLSVPIHNSRLPTGRIQLIFLSGKLSTTFENLPFFRETRPASRVPIHTSPPGVSAIEITRALGAAAAADASDTNLPLLYLRASLMFPEKRASPFFPRHIAVIP